MPGGAHMPAIFGMTVVLPSGKQNKARREAVPLD